MARRLPQLACLLLMLLPSICVRADDDDYMQARRLVESGSILPLPQILNKVRNKWPGRILELELEGEPGAYIYEIELLDDHGRVLELNIDAASGRMLKIKTED